MENIKEKLRLVLQDGTGESESEIGLSDLGGLAEGSNRTGVALLTDERLWKRGYLCHSLVGSAGFVACKVLEPFHDRHHGGVATAGTARRIGESWRLSVARYLSGCQ